MIARRWHHARTAFLFAVACITIVFTATRAHAQEGGAETSRAKMLFTSGTQAYAAGQFDAAIQAFTEANRILPRPAIVYSLGQAHRKQYFVNRNKVHLDAAIHNFRAYIEQVPDGGRRAEAAQALSELEPMAARLGGPGSPVRAAEPAKEPARLMVSTQVNGAWFAIDGKGRRPTGIALEITPGKHVVRTGSEGYFDDERTVEVLDHTFFPLVVELRERPARLTITAPSGSDIAVDGRQIGMAPLSEPIELPSGLHLVTVTKNGYKAFAQEIEFQHNERKSLNVSLESTGQRVVARTLLIGGGVAALAGGAFTLIALNRESAASDLAKEPQPGPDAVRDYEEASSARDRWRTGAIVAFSVAGAALATGVVLHIFDRPIVAQPRTRPEERKPRPAPPLEPMEMSMVPLVSPSFGGAAFVGRF